MHGLSQISRWREKLYNSSGYASVLRRYGIATIFVLLAFFLRDAFSPVLKNALPFTFFLTSSMLAAYFAGIGPGLFALLLGWIVGDYFFVQPVGYVWRYGKVELISVISTLVPSLIAIVLIEVLHRARRRAKKEIAERQLVEAELVQAKQQLEEHAILLEERVAERTESLEKSVKFFENFCYSIAHDLRAPLRAMQGFVQALKEDYSPHFDDTGRNYAQRIVDASGRMDRLILDLLAYGKLNHEKLHIREVNMERCVRETVEHLKKEIFEHRADIEIHEPLLNVLADAALLSLAIFHLLNNALKFGLKGMRSRINIWTEDIGPMVRLNIQDNGIGIRPEHYERIFRLFETLETSPNMATGVGLAIVAKAVDRMGGVIKVQSQKGEGSTFSIELPKVLAKEVSASGCSKLPKERIIFGTVFSSPRSPS